MTTPNGHHPGADESDLTPPLIAAGRFEWERVVRRLVVPRRVKLIALLAANYADPDGSHVRPGMDRLAAVTGYSEKTVGQIWAIIRDELGLVKLVRRGGGRGGGGTVSLYQLTIPTDLLERAPMLDPDEPHWPEEHVPDPERRCAGVAKVTGKPCRAFPCRGDRYCGRHGGRPQESHAGSESAEHQGSGQSTVDNVDRVEVQSSGQSPDRTEGQSSDQSGEGGPIDRKFHADPDRLTGSFMPIDRNSRVPTTTHTNHLNHHPLGVDHVTTVPSPGPSGPDDLQRRFLR